MIALITPTGARAKQIELCAQFMKRQDYEGEVLWVIVDDAIPITVDCITEDFRPGWTIVKEYPKPAWVYGQNTQYRNLLAGCAVVKKFDVKAVFIIEDDDYYSPRYLREMMERMGKYDIIGEQCTIYYNPILRGWINNNNKNHSSLFQTAFAPSMIPTFERICVSKNGRFIDMTLYRRFGIPLERINLFKADNLAVGIKGISGRAGIGQGHRLKLREKLAPDPNMDKLKELIGDDYIYYINIR